MDVYERIHTELKNCGITLAASLPDDWVAPLIARIEADNSIIHVPVAREAEATAICSGAFFGGVRAVAIMGATGLLTCTGDLGTLSLRHHIPVFCIATQRGSFDDHRVHHEIPAGACMRCWRRTIIPPSCSTHTTTSATSRTCSRPAGCTSAPTSRFSRRLVKGGKPS